MHCPHFSGKEKLRCTFFSESVALKLKIDGLWMGIWLGVVVKIFRGVGFIRTRGHVRDRCASYQGERGLRAKGQCKKVKGDSSARKL